MKRTVIVVGAAVLIGLLLVAMIVFNPGAGD